MATLYAFLNPEPAATTKEVIVSERFKDESGKVVPFIIKPISQDLNNQLNRLATVKKMVRGQNVEMFDTAAYTNKLIVACTVQPDFKAEDLCKAYGTFDAEEVPAKMLLPGEFAALSDAILKLNGFDTTSVPELEDEAKN